MHNENANILNVTKEEEQRIIETGSPIEDFQTLVEDDAEARGCPEVASFLWWLVFYGHEVQSWGDQEEGLFIAMLNVTDEMRELFPDDLPNERVFVMQVDDDISILSEEQAKTQIKNQFDYEVMD